MIYLKEGKTPLNFAYNDEIIQEGNSKYQLSFKFPTNNPLWEELVEETLLLADDLHGEQEFIIFEVEKHHAYITVYANQVATLLNNYSITELSVNNASGDRVMRSLVSSIIREHKFTFSSDIANTHSLNLKNVTVATALFKDKHSILGQWGGDLIRDKYDIRLLSNGGATKEALFMYKKNLKSYQQKKSIKDLRTRIHFTKTINSQKEGEKDKVIAVTVDSPLINKYKNIYEGNLDVSDQDVVDEATLRKYGEQYFKTTLCDVIEENIEINVVGTPDVPVGIFDTVTIFHEKFNLDVKKKITKYTYSPMGRKLKTIGFGKIQSNLGTTLATMVDNAIEEKAETMLDAFKIQKNLAQLLKLDRKGIEDKLVELEEKSKGALEVKKALFEADGTIPDVVKAKILDAVEGDIGRLKTIITEAELIKAIQAKLNFAEIKNALIDKAFINQIISDEKFTQQFEDGEVTTQNIFTKLKDSIKSNISKEFVTKDGVKKLVNDLTIDADGIRQITQQEITNRRDELKGKSSYMHTRYSDNADGSNFDTNSNRKYIGVYTGDKEQAPTSVSEYSWTKIKSDGKLYKSYSNSLNGLDFTLVEPDGNAKLFAKNRPRVNIVNNNDISDIWQANMFLSFKPNTKYTLTARAKGNSNKLWAYFRNNRTSEEYSWGQLEFRGLETKSITFTTTNDVEDVLFKFVLVPEDEDWTGIQIDWFTIYEGDKRYTDYPVNEPAQYQKYRYFGYVFKEDTPVASDFEWFDLQQTSITNDKYTHIVYSDNADGSNFGREPKKYMGVARTTSPTQPTDKTAYKWFKLKGEDGERGRDGVSNYIHRKYSDNSNGANMSDDSSLKYIGIYTGSSSTPPTTASSYLWSKIKGEDGVNGTPGARGLDGRTPYFHTAYSNSPTGDRDFSTTDSNGKQYIGTYSDFEINDSNDYRRYKWVKIKGENGRNGTDGHSLTATLWFTGGYVNNTTNRVFLNLIVYYDGREIRDFKSNITYKGGGISNWTTQSNLTISLDNTIVNKFWSDGEKDGTTLFALATVTYNGLQTVADARLENVPDVRVLSETIKKYKTFESTLDGFTSVVGEIDTKVLSKSYFKNNLNSEDVEKTGNDLYFNAKENLQANEYYTILADLDNVPANQQAYIYSASDGGDKKIIQNGLNYWIVKYPSNQTRINLYPLGANTKVKNVRIFKGDFRVKEDKENLYKGEIKQDTTGGPFLILKLKRNLKSTQILTIKFDATGFNVGDKWDISYRPGYEASNLSQNFKEKDNTFTFNITTTTNEIFKYLAKDEVIFQYSNARKTPTLSNIRIYEENIELGYAKTEEVSKLESSIRQTKSEIDLKVSKDEVIASINASVETTGEGPAQGVVKINADKVDISGVLSAYTGEIGGFRIGANPNDGGGLWLTGKTNFDCGMNPGVNEGSNGAQFWAAWGRKWTKPGPNAWWVTAQGIMVCKNTPTFHKGMEVYGRYIDTHSNDIQGDQSGGGKTTVIWWSQINSVKSQISDQRLKTNIKPTKIKALDTLNNIEMVEFNWKKDNKFEKIGAIAQQVQTINKDLVVHDMDDKQTYNDYLRINYYDTIPYLIKGIQELSQENTNLKSQLKAMNERLQKLEDKINGNI